MQSKSLFCLLVVFVAAAIGCGTKVTQLDPVQATQSNEAQKVMVQQERGL